MLDGYKSFDMHYFFMNRYNFISKCCRDLPITKLGRKREKSVCSQIWLAKLDSVALIHRNMVAVFLSSFSKSSMKIILVSSVLNVLVISTGTWFKVSHFIVFHITSTVIENFSQILDSTFFSKWCLLRV